MIKAKTLISARKIYFQPDITTSSATIIGKQFHHTTLTVLLSAEGSLRYTLVKIRF